MSANPPTEQQAAQAKAGVIHERLATRSEPLGVSGIQTSAYQRLGPSPTAGRMP